VPWDNQTPPGIGRQLTTFAGNSELKTKPPSSSSSEFVCNSTEPAVAAPLSNKALSYEADCVLWETTRMANAIRDARDFSDLKAAVIFFITSMDFTIPGDADLLDLAAQAVVFRDRSVTDGLTMFGVALKREQRAAEFFGEMASK
jgi:hypothetical protein